MLTFISVIHIIAALILIGLVLAQDSKGGGMGMLSGGGSSSVFGATGGENILVKGTKLFATIFAATCVTLTYMSADHTKSVIDDLAPSVATDSAKAGAAATTETAPTEPAMAKEAETTEEAK